MCTPGCEGGGLKSGVLDQGGAEVCTPESEEMRLSLSMTLGYEAGLTSGPWI